MTTCDKLWLLLQAGYWVAAGGFALFACFQAGRWYEKSKQ